MEALGLIINAIWELSCIPFRVSENITIVPWQFIGFIIILALISNKLFGQSGGEK